MTSNLSRSRKQFWEDHVDQCNASELSQAEYCRRHKISLKSFQYWKKKTKRGSSAPALVELTVPKSSPIPLLEAQAQLCLIVGQHYRIEIRKGFDSEALERVVRILGRI